MAGYKAGWLRRTEALGSGPVDIGLLTTAINHVWPAHDTGQWKQLEAAIPNTALIKAIVREYDRLLTTRREG